jgi:hypothetical protein
MKASELRLNNLLERNGSIVCLDTNYDLFVALVYVSRSDRKYKPIPLTEEWLLKFGFNEEGIDKRTFCSAFVKNGVRVTISNSGNVYYGKLCVESVHQLQNLYFALTREELTFI